MVQSAELLKENPTEDSNKIYGGPYTLLYGSRSLVLTKKEWSCIQVAEMKYLTSVEGCKREDGIRNDNIPGYLNIYCINKKINKYKN